MKATSLTCAQLVETLTTGGAETLAVQIANARAAAGDRSLLYVLQDQPDDLARRIDPAVTVRRLGLDRAPLRRLVDFTGSVVRGYRRLAAQVRADGVEVVQSHLPGPNFWTLLLAERAVCATVPTVHNTREFDYGDADHPLRRRLRHAAYRRLLRRCDATVAVSAEVRDALLGELGLATDAARRLVVVTNGVVVPTPLAAPARAALRARAGVPPEVPWVLAAGRLTAQKDFATLVDAAAALRDGGRRLAVVIGGEGELRGHLERRIAERGLADVVRLPGVLPDLDEHLRAADLFVLPSRWEGLPLVLLEAMAAGCPVVCTRLEGLDDLVGGAGAGLLAPPGDAAALAGAIGELLDDAPLRRACGERARAAIEARYDFRHVSDRLGALYREVVAARRGRGTGRVGRD